ncbi:MAG TPA: hypothetical protein VLD65_12905 [Anaerolineales bacterium]|nr:hypothetical protein [Anaerolineales bacterium]
MTTETLIYRSTYLSNFLSKDWFAGWIKWFKSILPRPCMMVSSGLIIAGLSIPFLMGLTLIPASLFLGFIGMISTCIGIVLTFYYL